nr:RNA-directed DNA polymerase, eukaryota, reverse transcriptase zinc-binding domain protein [Tanacetum cinerariifolium]
MDKEGLGIGSIAVKILAFSGNRNGDSSRRTVIQEFYVSKGGFGSDLNPAGIGGVWHDIIKAVNKIDSMVDSSNNYFSIKVLTRTNTSFWKYPWFGDGDFHLSSTGKDKWVRSGYPSGEHHHWNSGLPKKVNVFNWRASINRLPTRSNLSYRGVHIVNSCSPFCENVIEHIDHCLSNCHIVAAVQRKMIGCSRINKILNGVLQCSLWAIWEWRNRIINAEQDMVRKVKDEDIFPSIQRTSKL